MIRKFNNFLLKTINNKDKKLSIDTIKSLMKFSFIAGYLYTILLLTITKILLEISPNYHTNIFIALSICFILFFTLDKIDRL